MNYVFNIINIVFIFVGAGVVCFNQRVAGLSCVGQYILEVYLRIYIYILFIYEIYIIPINRTHALHHILSIHSSTICRYINKYSRSFGALMNNGQTQNINTPHV